jgi:hypothetical protein
MKKRIFSFALAIIMSISLGVVPSAEEKPNDNSDFLGYVDFDMDGTGEEITAGEDIEVRNDKGKIVFTIPVGWTEKSKKIWLWSIERNENGEIKGTVSLGNVLKYYTVSDGKAEFFGEALTNSGIGNSGVVATASVKMNTENVIYGAGALSYGEQGLSQSKAKADFDKLQQQINALKKNAPNGYYAMINIADGKTRITGKATEKNTVIYQTDFTFDVKNYKPNAKIKEIIDRDNTDFLGFFDYDMDGTAEVVIREKNTNIYSEKGDLICAFPLPKNDIITWYVCKNYDGDIIGSVEGYDYIIKKGKPEPYTGDGPENVTWMENIVYYTLDATDYDDADYASGKAKTDVMRLLSQAKYLEPEGWGNGYFAMLYIEHGKTKIVGYASSGDGIFINGNLVPFDGGGYLYFHIDPAYDSEPERNGDSLVLISRGYGGNIIHPEVPVFITDDDDISLPHGDYGIGNSFGVENGIISVEAIGSNFQPSGEYPNEWASHAYTFEKYFFYRQGDALIEYGAIDFPITKFIKLKNSLNVLKRIADDGMSITNILYRGNNYVNINCTKEEDGEIWCYYYSYHLNENNEIELDTLVTQRGKYYPSILEEEGIDTVKYPSKLPV